MALWLIGLGLYDAKDVSVRGMERIRAADRVVAEFYTAHLAGTPPGELAGALGVAVELLDRDAVEKGGSGIVADAAERDVAFLTAGDPLAATTHTDLVMRARAAGVQVHVIHGASIYAAAPGLVGLQHYKFGRTTTLARPEGDWMPTSPFEAIQANREVGLHTLVLLDIKADENWYMTAQDGIELFTRLADKVGAAWWTDDTPIAAIARAGAPDCIVRTGTVATVQDADLGPPLHTLVVPGDMHVVEQEAWDSLV